jgi:hypothetical protein
MGWAAGAIGRTLFCGAFQPGCRGYGCAGSQCRRAWIWCGAVSAVHEGESCKGVSGRTEVSLRGAVSDCGGGEVVGDGRAGVAGAVLRGGIAGTGPWSERGQVVPGSMGEDCATARNGRGCGGAALERGRGCGTARLGCAAAAAGFWCACGDTGEDVRARERRGASVLSPAGRFRRKGWIEFGCRVVMRRRRRPVLRLRLVDRPL